MTHQTRGKVETLSSNSFTSSLWPLRLSEVVKYFNSPIWKMKPFFYHSSPLKQKINYSEKTQQSKNNPNWCYKIKKHKRFHFKNSEELCRGFDSYRLHCSQDINDWTIKTLPIGQNVSQRVEISGILHWTVDKWHQPIDGCRVSTHIHLGMSLWYH